MDQCKPLCSLPHGMYTIVPYFMTSMATVLTFITFSSCAMISTEWAIDCSMAPNSSNCVYVARMEMGLLEKQVFVAVATEPGEMEKICQRYTDEERIWLLDGIWDISFITHLSCIVIGVSAMILLLTASCCSIKVVYFKIMSIFMGITSLVNAVPLLILLYSGVCKVDDGICDPTQTNCVSSCEMGNGSWQVIAATFMWISATISMYSICPADEKKQTVVKKKNHKSAKIGDEDFFTRVSSFGTEIERQSSEDTTEERL